MPELSAPLRVTWEIPSDPSAAESHWRELVRSRVLFVELSLPPGHLVGLAGIADELTVPDAPRLTLAAAAQEAAAARDGLSTAAAASIELLLLPPHATAGASALAAGFRGVTWAVWSTGAGLALFPAALEAARVAGGGTVAVLNPRSPAPALTGEQRRRAVEAWERGRTADLQLRVHDLFLARDLGLEPFREYAGCQAGDGLAHLSAAGVVTACRTLPVVLGSLTAGGLREIWAGDARRDLRRKLAEAPAACAGCAVEGRCRGGCRGLLPGGRGSADLAARDPSCPGALAAAEGGNG